MNLAGKQVKMAGKCSKTAGKGIILAGKRFFNKKSNVKIPQCQRIYAKYPFEYR